MIVMRIAPLSLAKLAGLLYGVIGLIAGAIISLISVAGGFGAGTSEHAGFAAIMGVAAIVALPVLYGVMGFLAALLVAWLYNVLAGSVGGVELDVR